MLEVMIAALLQVQPQFPGPVERLVRIAAGPGTRDNPAALVTPSGTAVVWEEVRSARYLLVQGGTDASGGSVVPAGVLVGGWGHQWGPSLAATGDTIWLACYQADVSRRTGDRDVMVVRYRGRFAKSLDTIRVTRDPPHAPFPINDASPSLILTDSRRALVVWSEGEFHEQRPAARAYDDKDIMLAELRGAAPFQVRKLTTGQERGREMSPALAHWNSPAGERYLLAYLSQVGDAPYALELALFDGNWHRLSTRIIAKSKGGIAHPSLQVLSGVPYLSWTDNGNTDVTIARLDGSLRTIASQSLRKALAASNFASYGAPLAGLSGAQLFDDGGKLGVAFVATMEYQPAAGNVRQEIFLARFR